MDISSDAMAANDLANTVKIGLSDYLDFPTERIVGEDPVSGSNTHDGVDDELGKAIGSWSDLITSDSNYVISSHECLAKADLSVKLKILGVK